MGRLGGGVYEEKKHDSAGLGFLSAEQEGAGSL